MPGSTPGKQTLTEKLPPAQRDSQPVGNPGGSTDTPSETAAYTEPLPHLDKIQQSFGHHDVSAARAQIGGTVAQAADALGAKAYTTGNTVGFRSAPDLRLAAHEAAHVVQQQRGVQLKSDLDTGAQDPFEQHADLVADIVVMGQSAEPLLDQLPAGGATSPTAVQRFTEDEHRELGDLATGNRQFHLGPGLTVSYGTIVSLAGDYFGSPNDLMQVARTPGKGKGTQEEIAYIITCKFDTDRASREEAAAKARNDTAAARKAHDQKAALVAAASGFTKEARDAVDKRFMTLAVSNAGHFPDPMGTGSPDVMVGVEDVVDTDLWNPHVLFDELGGSPSSAASGYRLRHIHALGTAYTAGKNHKAIDAALIEEAFGGHYLTDSFSAGHVRTARTGIKEMWSARAPMFWFNLQGYIGQAIAEDLAQGGVVPPSIYYDGVDATGPTGGGIKVTGAAETIRTKFAEQAPISFGDLVSGILHDKDNEHGVDVTSDGQRATLKGDGHLGEADEKQLAIKAVQAGVREVEAIHAAGTTGVPRREAIHRLLVNDRFAAERLMPHALPEAQQAADHKQVPWQAATPELLLQKPEFQAGAFTFMQGKAATMRESIADMSESNRQVFEKAVLRPLVANPASMARTLQAVLDWVPNPRAVRQTVMDEYVRDYFKVVKNTPGGLATLTLAQRKKIIDGLKDTDDINSVIKSSPGGQQSQLADYALQALRRGDGSEYRGM